MKTIRCITIGIAILLMGSAVAQADNRILKALPRDTTLAEVEVPALLTRIILLENASDVSRNISEDFLLPKGWQIVSRDSSFILGPNSREIRLFCISIPAFTLPGFYSLSYIALDRKDPAAEARCAIEVRVQPQLNVSISLGECPRRVLAGNEYAFRFFVTNLSNSSCTILLQAQSSQQYPVRFTVDSLRMSPGEKAEVNAIVTPARRISKGLLHRIEVKASIAQAPKPCAVSMIAATEVLPRPSQGDDPYQRIPSRAVMRWVNDKRASGLQIEYAGEGVIDSKGKYRLKYFLRGPRDLKSTTFGMRDEYSLGIATKEGEVRVGDMLYGVSTLMGQNHYGRGLKAAANYRNFRAGFYSFSARETDPMLRETAGYVSYQPKEMLKLRAHALNRKTFLLNRAMAGLASSISLQRLVNLEVEYAIGEGRKHSSQAAHSYLTRLNGSWKGNRLSFEKTYAGAEYPGEYHDQDYNLAALYMAPRKDIRCWGSYRYERRNLNADPSRSTASRDGQAQTGVSYSFSQQREATLELERYSRRDVISPTLFDWREQSATLRGHQNYKKMDLGLSARFGRLHDNISGSSSDLERYGVSVNYVLDAAQTLGVTYQNGHSGTSLGAQRNRTLCLNTVYRGIPHLILSLSYQKNDFGRNAKFENDQVIFDARYTLFRQHIFAVRYRQLDYKNEGMDGGKSFLFSYELPVGMPVGRQMNSGIVRGKLYDMNDPLKKGIAGATLMLDGDIAMTDRKGNFAFHSVKPGTHYLQVDRAGIGLLRVTARKLPMEILVRGGHTEELALGVTQGSSLCGTVGRFGLADDRSRSGILVESNQAQVANNSSELIPLATLPRVFMELRCGKEVLQALTDERGEFMFTELRPGTWTLLVSNQSLPDQHEFEKDRYEIVVEPGTNQNLSIRVLPKIRPIQMIEQNKTRIISVSR